jgi:DNA-binding NarL/FixJ family response regulator/signal transduction histidine kinase
MENHRRFLIGAALLVLVLALLGCRGDDGPLPAPAPVRLTDAQTRIPLGVHLAYLEDPSGALTLADVTAPPYSRQFTASRAPYPDFGLTQSAYWIRITLRNESGRPTPWLLEIGPPYLDAIDVYAPESGGAPKSDREIRHVHMGDRLPFHEREIAHRHFLLDLPLSPHADQTLYLRMQDQTRIRIAMTLWEPDAFARAQALWTLGYGIFHGAALMMALNGLLVFLMFRERLFLYFSLYVLISLLIFLSWNGFAYQYLWPNRVRWQSTATLALFCTATSIHFIFTAEFLRIRRTNLTLYRLMHLGALLAAGLMVMLVTTGHPAFRQIFYLLSMPTALFFGGVGCYVWQQHQRTARTYLLIWGLYNLSFLITAASEFGILSSNPLTDHISQIIFVLTLPFILVWVADRLSASRHEKEKAQREALRASRENERLMREQNVRLERDVAARTRALREAKAGVERSRTMLQTVFDNLDMLIYVADIETYEILFINARTRAEFGDVEGRVCWQVLQRGQTGSCDFCTNDYLIEDGEPTGTYQWEFQNPVTGRWYHIQDQAFRWPDGRLVRIEVATDITDRKQAERQVLEQQRHLARLEERKRIGDTLHDDLGQVISYVNVQAQTALGLLAQDQETQAEAALKRLVDIAQEAHGDVRAYILGARESQAPEGFFAALAAHIQMLHQRYGLQVDLQLPEDVPAPFSGPEAQNQALSIVREALTNVAKHAEVDTAQLTVQATGGVTHITVRDQGRGFPPEPTAEAGAHFGLAMMRERAERIGGTLHVIAKPGAGTRVTLDVPHAAPELERAAAPLEAGLRLLLVDDHPLFLEGLRHMLTTQGAHVVGVAHDGDEAVAMAEAHQPDIILMDVEMPACDGVEATRRITARFPDVKIAMLTVVVDDEVLFEALKAGASGYLLKNLDSETLFARLSDLMQDQVVIDPRLANRVLDAFADRPTDPRPEHAEDEGSDTDPDGAEAVDLTPRQIEVLQAVADGLTYKEVGTRLHISERTVKYHMGQVLKRMQLKSRAQAIAYATQQGLIEDSRDNPPAD